MSRTNYTQAGQFLYLSTQAFFKRYGALLLIGASLMFFCDLLHAKDILASSLEGDVKDTLGSGGVFWKILTLISIVLASVAAIGSKNPLAFLGVFGVVFIPTALIKVLVF